MPSEVGLKNLGLEKLCKQKKSYHFRTKIVVMTKFPDMWVNWTKFPDMWVNWPKFPNIFFKIT